MGCAAGYTVAQLVEESALAGEPSRQFRRKVSMVAKRASTTGTVKRAYGGGVHARAALLHFQRFCTHGFSSQYAEEDALGMLVVRSHFHFRFSFSQLFNAEGLARAEEISRGVRTHNAAARDNVHCRT